MSDKTSLPSSRVFLLSLLCDLRNTLVIWGMFDLTDVSWWMTVYELFSCILTLQYIKIPLIWRFNDELPQQLSSRTIIFYSTDQESIRRTDSFPERRMPYNIWWKSFRSFSVNCDQDVNEKKKGNHTTAENILPNRLRAENIRSNRKNFWRVEFTAVTHVQPPRPLWEVHVFPWGQIEWIG